MQKRGFFVPTWLGWVTGFILLKKPWGSPEFKPWILIWSGIILVIQHTLLLDLLRQSKFVNSLAVNALAKNLHDVMFIVAYLAFWTVRLLFLIHAKTLANLLHSLYNYPVKKEFLKWKKAWIIANFFILLSGTLVISSATIFTIAFKSKPREEDASWFYVFGRVASGVIGGFFGHFATMSSTNVAFAMIVYISFYLGMIFCDFCDEVEDFLQAQKKLFVVTEFPTLGDDGFKREIFLQGLLSRDILLNKFEGIRNLFRIGDKITSPLVLVVIVAETFRSVSGAHEILINRQGFFFVLDNYLVLTQQLIHTGLVLVGQYVEDKMCDRRKQLHKIVTLIQEPDTEHQRAAVHLAKYVAEFDWRLSACGFFHVDKKLLSGIMATAMTYIMILVQLQLSLGSSSCHHIPISNITNQTQINQ